MLIRIGSQIDSAWARADELLESADAALDPDEEARLEQMYGRIAALATSLEEDAARLKGLRNELGAAIGRTAP